MMAYTDWLMRGPKIGSCNCDYGCPCKFSGRPSRGSCEGLEAHLIEEGFFGEVRFDGLIVAARYHWPGAVHEGGGTIQRIIDERATAAQRGALLKIFGGEEQEPTTIFNIYNSTMAKELDPVFAPIEFGCDIDGRTGRLVVPGMMELSIEPIRNPVTALPQGALIRLPQGFEFREAEMGSGTFQSQGELAMTYRDCYAALFLAAYGPYGVVEH